MKGADLGVGGDRLVLDFNFAYNPSCAYDPQWSCPLPPPANRLSVRGPGGGALPLSIPQPEPGGHGPTVTWMPWWSEPGTPNVEPPSAHQPGETKTWSIRTSSTGHRPPKYVEAGAWLSRIASTNVVSMIR